jgi:hypothetical protein
MLQEPSCYETPWHCEKLLDQLACPNCPQVGSMQKQLGRCLLLIELSAALYSEMHALDLTHRYW